MKSEILSLGKQSVIYGVGIVISKLASIIMLPIYTRYLTPADYGVAELLTTTTDIIGMIAAVGLTATIFKFYAEYEAPDEKNEVISTAFILLFGISCVTAALGVVLSGKISGLIFGLPTYHSYFRLMFGVYLLQQGMVVIPLMFLRAKQNSKRFLLVSVTKLIIQVCLNLYFLVFLEKGLVGILYSSLLAETVIGLYLGSYLLRSVGLRFSGAKARKMLRFGYPFIFTSLSSFALHYSDRYFLNAYTDLSTVGIYALAYKFGFLLSAFAVGPFSQVWEPRRFEIIRQQDGKAIFKRVFFYLNVGLIFSALSFSLLAGDILRVMADKAYLPAQGIVPVVILAFILQAWGTFCNIGAYLKNRSSYLSLSALAAAAVNILLNIILIPRYGAYGAAWATVGGFFIRFIIVDRLSQKLFTIDYGWGKVLGLLGISVVFYSLGFFMFSLPTVFSVGVKVGMLALFLAITYQMFLEEREKKEIKRLAQKPFLGYLVSVERGSR